MQDRVVANLELSPLFRSCLPYFLGVSLSIQRANLDVSEPNLAVVVL